MYSESELSGAVDAGILPEDQAAAFRDWVASQRQLPREDEEHFRLLSGFNDIFVAIAAIIALVAVWMLGDMMLPSYNYALPDGVTGSPDLWVNAREKWLGAFLCAALAWGLAEYFTRVRRMAFPSIVLLGGFVGGLAFGMINLLQDIYYNANGYAQDWWANASNNVLTGGQDIARAASNAQEYWMTIFVMIAAVIVCAATFVHWLRFKVPISIAALTAAAVAAIAAAIFSVIGIGEVDATVPMAIIFVLGLGVFTWAMRWDFSDVERKTRRSDVAFWLHLLAAPLIAHPLFYLIGVMNNDDIGALGAIAVLLLYLFFALVALAIDRRALLVSALAYVLVALTSLLRGVSDTELSIALTALIIGSALLVLSAFWGSLRAGLIGSLPDVLRSRLPRAEVAEGANDEFVAGREPAKIVGTGGQ